MIGDEELKEITKKQVNDIYSAICKVIQRNKHYYSNKEYAKEFLDLGTSTEN